MSVDLLDDVISLGRPGGVALLLAAALCFGFMWWDLETNGSFYIFVPAFGIAFGLVGVLLFIFGDPSKRRLRAIEDVPVPPGLAERLAAHRRPFHFCTACYEIAPSERCELCDRVVPVMQLRDEADVPLALAALEPRGGAPRRKTSRFRAPKPRPGSAVSAELLRGVLDSTPRPFYVCTRCCQLGRDGWCDRCDSGLDVLEIRDDDDARMALLAVG